MATITADNTSEAPHIGPAHHVGRNVGILLGVLAMAALAIVYTFFGKRSDAAEVSRLQAFMSTYAEKCDDRVAGPTTPLMNRLYVNSDKLQSVVDDQAKALADGTSCRDVYAALRAADFPVPPAK